VATCGRDRTHRRALARTRGREYGRRRAARRVRSGSYAPHPGWRNRVPAGRVVLRDQAAALNRVDELVDAEDWRVDKRTAWTAMLRRLVFSADWETGLVCGLTRAQLTATAGVGLRTVTSMLAWARHVGLLVEIEAGASAAFLGTEVNRAPSYVLTVPADFAPSRPVDTSCDLPASSDDSQPLDD